MTPRNRSFAILAGAAAVVIGGACLLAGGSSSPPSGPVAAQRSAATVSTASRARPSYAVVAGKPADAPAALPSTAPVADESVRRARELFLRLEKAAGRDPTLPPDLQRELLEFLTGSEADRTALFRMVWEPGSSRMVLGHLKLFLVQLPDEARRAVLVAALESFDPLHAERVEMAAKARDPELLASELRLAPAGEDKARRIRMLDKESCAQPALARFLLETARDDRDPDTRTATYIRLSIAGVAEAVPVLVAAVGDDARSATERGTAAMALGLGTVQPSPEELVRLYEAGTVDVRRNLLAALAKAPADRRIDDLLLEALAGEEGSLEMRKFACNAIGMRIFRLPAEEARDLGARTARAMKDLTPEYTAAALRSLGTCVVQNQPLREAVQDLHRTSPAGGAIQLAIASSPALRMVAGL